jgi:hypothetical protein
MPTDTPTPHGVLLELQVSRDRQSNATPQPIRPDAHPEHDPEHDPDPDPVIDAGTLATIAEISVAGRVNRLTIADPPGN